MPITFNSNGGFLNGTISSSNGDLFINTSGSAGKITVGNVEYTGSQIIEKDAAGNERNKKTFNADGTITQEKFDASAKIVETKIKNPSTGEEFRQSGSSANNQIIFQQNNSGAFITVSGSQPGFNVLKSEANNEFRQIRHNFDMMYAGDESLFTIGIAEEPRSWYINPNIAAGVSSNTLLEVSQSGDVFVKGNIYAQEFHTELISSSIVFQSGSTQFGDTHDDTHTFTGKFTNAITASADISSSGTITGNELKGTTISISTAANVTSLTNLNVADTTGQTGVDLSLSALNGRLTAAVSGLDTDDNVQFNQITASGNISSSGTITMLTASIGGGIFTSASLAAGGSSDDLSWNDGTATRVSGSHISSASFGHGHFDRLGVNSKNPGYTLQVAGDMGIANYIYHNGDDDTHILMEEDMINLVAGGKSIIKGDEDEGWIRINNTNANLDFQVNADDGEIVLHSDAGTNKVGINTTTPGEALEVVGNISASGDLFVGQISSSGTGNNFLNGNLRISDAIYNPSHLLDLSGSNADGEMILVRGNKADGGTIRYQRGTSYSWRAGVGGGSSTNSNIPSSFWGIEDVSDSNTVAIAIAHSTQRVGINDTSPSAQLDVNGNLQVQSHITASGNISCSGLLRVEDIRDNTNSSDLVIRPDGKLNLGTTASDEINIGRQSGTCDINIYANTSTPAARFVTSTITFNHPITASGNISASGTNHSFGANVGIGLASPETQLHLQVPAGTTPELRVEGLGNTNSKLMLKNSQGNWQIYRKFSSKELVFENNAGDIPLILNQGHITASGNISASGGFIGNTLTLDGLSNQGSEATAVMINGSNVVGTRELGSNAFTSTTIGTTTNALTVDNATLQLNSGTTFNGSAARTISVKDGGIDSDALAADISVTSLTSTHITASGNISSSGAIKGGSLDIKNNAVITGSLGVSGSSVTLHKDAALHFGLNGALGGTIQPTAGAVDSFKITSNVGDITLNSAANEDLFISENNNLYAQFDGSARLFNMLGSGSFLNNVSIGGNFSTVPTGDTKLSVIGNISSSGTLISNEINTIGHITASGNISSSGASHTFGGTTTFGTGESDGIKVSNVISHAGDTDTKLNFTPDQLVFTIGNDQVMTLKPNVVKLSAPVTASGNISASGVISGSDVHVTDDLSVGGVLSVAGDIQHVGDTDTKIVFGTDSIALRAGATELFKVTEASPDTISFGAAISSHITASGNISGSATTNLQHGGATIHHVHTFDNGDDTPDVSGGTVFLTNGTNPAIGGGNAHTITTFDGGTAGQIIHVLIEDAFTTFTNGTNLKLFRGINATSLTTNDIISFICEDGTVWREMNRQDNS